MRRKKQAAEADFTVVAEELLSAIVYDIKAGTEPIEKLRELHKLWVKSPQDVLAGLASLRAHRPEDQVAATKIAADLQDNSRARLKQKPYPAPATVRIVTVRVTEIIRRGGQRPFARKSSA